MKRKNLLFLLLLALGLPWAANAQETLTVCDGTDGNSNVPIYGLYCDEGVKCEYIIPAALLEEMDNATISAMKFYIKSISGVLSADFTVFMKEVSFTTMTAFTGTTDATIVYNGSISLTGTSTEMDIEFSENYTYNGGNLLVGFYQNGTSGYKSVTWTGESQTYASAWAGYGTSSNANGSGKNFLPKTTFTYTPGAAPSCQKPTNLEVSNVSSTNASFSWTKGGDETEWVLEYSTASNFTNAVSVPRSGIPAIAINDFNSGTTYYARVKAVCGDDDESTWSNVVSFTTLCDAITSFPWSEDFESYSASSSGVKFEDPCWENIHLEGSGTYFFEVYSGTNGTNSTKQLRLHDMSSGTMTKLRLPEMTLTTGDSYLFSIDVYRVSATSYTGEGIRVYASTDGEIEGATELAFISRNFGTGDGNLIPAESASGWYTYELPIPFTGTCYIILRGESKYGSATYMDNFKVKKELPCVKPADPTFVSATTTSATLSWTNGAEGQTAWQIAYSTDPTFNPDAVTPVDVTSNPGSITGLTSATTYYAYVRANCGSLGYSEWSMTYCEFATACDAITTFPWTENFESFAAGNFAAPCWINERIQDGTGYGTLSIFKINTSTNGTNTTHQLQLPDMPAGTLTKLVLPEMTLPGNDYQFVLDVYRNTNSKPTEGIRVYVSTDGELAGATELAFISRDYTVSDNDLIPAEAASGWYTYQLPLGISGTCYVILQGESQYGSSTYMDNFFVEQIPSCPKPQNLAVTNNSVTAHGATVTWAETGEATTWVVEYATNADFTAASTETVNDEPTYTFEGLDPETTYYVRVKAHCGEGNDSQYSNTVNFTTDAACKVPTGLTVTNLTATTATLSWTENGESASWQICLNNDEENLINANTNPYTLEGLTAETVYTAKVRGICNGEPTGWSSAVSFEPTAKLVIGSGTGTSSYLPSNTNYDFSYTQQIYTVAELGEAGVIESIDFYMTSTLDYTRNLDIYMVSTDKESFANNMDWIAVTEADLVFSGDVNFTAQSWTTITLDDSFIYNGTQNVAIIVDDNTEAWSSRSFRSFTVEANQSIYKYRDDDDIPITFAESGTLTTSKNQIRILKSEMSDCMKPTQFTATEVGPNFAVLDWTENGASESWYIFYGKTENSGYVPIEVVVHPYTLTGLNNETSYSAFVVPSCGVESGYPDNSLVSHTIEFTTLPGCPAPQNVEVSEITNSSVVVTWTGFNDSYNVRIENNSGFTETYENAESPLTIENLEGNPPYLMTVVGLCGETVEMEADPVVFTTKCDLVTEFPWSENFEDYEASSSGVTFSDPCWENIHLAGTGTYFFEVYSGTNGTNETNQLRLHDMSDGTMTKLMLPGMNLPNANYCFSIEVYRSTSYTNKTGEGIRVFASANGEIEGATELAFIPRLYSVESGVIPAEETGNQWYTYNLPIGMSGTCYIILRGESQYGTATYMDNFEVKEMPTFTKDIVGYGTSSGGYYLIASPVVEDITPSADNGFITDAFDLYYFNQAGDDEGNEWFNYKAGAFNIESGKGYLYASQEDTQLVFIGTPYSGDGEFPLSYSESESTTMKGWNLVGNPFAETAYVDRDYYTMGENGSEIVAATGNDGINRMEGVFVKATGPEQSVTFSTTAPESKSATLALNLSQGRGVIDRAIVRFGEGRTLPKFQIMRNSTKLYIPQDNEEFAVVSSAEQGEMPVSFKAAENGRYTLSVNTENVEANYLHLIDNMTGADIDLLSTPSYSFNANTTDYAQRFKLVFATGNASDDNFAFFSNGNFVINNEGEATLQVVDVTGRILSSEQISGSCSKSLNVPAGVYMLRLVNGENVKVQKVVVR